MLSLNQVRSLMITGASGFVGRSVIDYLSKLPQEKLPLEILLVTRNGIPFPLARNIKTITKIIKSDLRQPWSIDFQPTHVINLAADGSFAPYSAEANRDFELIVRNLLSWISDCTEKPRLFHASSGACTEYELNLSNEGIFSPRYEFAKNRKNVEDILESASKSLSFDLSVARLFSFSGTNLLKKRQYAISDFVNSAVLENQIYIKGNPNTIRSYLHQESMAEWILAALISTYVNTNLQIGSLSPVTLHDLATYVSEITHAIVSYSKNPPLADTYLPNNLDTRAKLGVEEGKSWEIAVEEMVNEMRVHYGKV
jgi:nucleoside-diphosphate-sugar epimerase